MPGGGAALTNTVTVDRVDAPITMKAYLICAFAAFGGIFFGFDSGYINGVLGMPYFIHRFTGLDYPTTAAQAVNFAIPAREQSLVVSILSAGTFFGALISGDLADFFGRRITIIAGCGIFSVGVALQVASSAYGLLIAGRLIAGLGVGFVSAIIILYMSEIAPRQVRGSVVSGYQFCITLGLLLASCVVYGTQNMDSSASYRIPIGLQWAWALILGASFFDSIRDLKADMTKLELAEIIANHEYEAQMIGGGGYIRSWLNCFTGSLFKPSSNLRRTILGTSAQMMQQFTGINFIFYFGTSFFKQLGKCDPWFVIPWTFPDSIRTDLTPTNRLDSEPIPDIPHHDTCQCLLNPNLLLDCRTFWTSGSLDLWRNRYDCLPIHHRYCRHCGRWKQLNRLCRNCLHLHLHLLLRIDLGSWCMGRCWRNVPSANQIPWGCYVGVVQLAVELHHRGHYSLHGLSLEQVDRMLEETTPRKSIGWKDHTTFGSFSEEMGIAVKGLEEGAVTIEKQSLTRAKTLFSRRKRPLFCLYRYRACFYGVTSAFSLIEVPITVAVRSMIEVSCHSHRQSTNASDRVVDGVSISSMYLRMSRALQQLC
nr:putative glucose transporter rco-3 [Quercus suber]